jgi:hypothetical protein
MAAGLKLSTSFCVMLRASFKNVPDKRGMSSCRLRRGGKWILAIRIRYKRSARNCPLSTASTRFRLVATKTRASTLRGLDSPNGVTSRSCKTRRRLVWTVRGMSPISSRNNVPPFAASKTPWWSDTAPVKAPRLCPNN